MTLEQIAEKAEAYAFVQDMANTMDQAATMLQALSEENERLKLQRDEAREQFDKHVAWASDQQAAAEARAIAAEDALKRIAEIFDSKTIPQRQGLAEIERLALAQKEGG